MKIVDIIYKIFGYTCIKCGMQSFDWMGFISGEEICIECYKEVKQ